MDYGRFNYVAQPGDGARLIPIIGPYDKFAVEWGYSEFKDANTYEQEKAKLDEIVARQLKDPTLLLRRPEPATTRRSRPRTSAPTPSRATELGLKNIDRVAGYLVKATSRKGEDYDQLRNMYDQLVSQRNRELLHVVANWSAASSRPTSGTATATSRTTPSPASSRRRPSRFLIANGLTTPKALIAPDIVQTARVQRRGRSHPQRPADDPPRPDQREPRQADGRAGRRRSQGRPMPRSTCSTTSATASGPSSRPMRPTSTSTAATSACPRRAS